jgi:hypothetical protein
VKKRQSLTVREAEAMLAAHGDTKPNEKLKQQLVA